MLTLAEVRDHAVALAGAGAAKLVDELTWRDYHQRVYAALGRRIWQDLRPYRTGHSSASYDPTLPPDVEAGTTGLACVDAWSSELRRTGYLHNHVRMWFAAYLVHHRRVAWQAGARFFLRHLLDGDPASNNLSWQWVASTSRSRPYHWNRDNLLRFAGDRYCAGCPLREAGCPFDASYDELAERLWAGAEAAPGEVVRVPSQELRRVTADPTDDPRAGTGSVVWVHGDRLSATNEALVAHPGAPAVFVWDTGLVAATRPSGKRLRFLAECLDEVPCEVRSGDVAAEVAAFAADHGVDTVATTASPSPGFARIRAALEAAGLQVRVWSPPQLAPTRGPVDLRSHTSYAVQVREVALRPTGSGGAGHPGC